VLSYNVTVGLGAHVAYSVLMPGAVVEDGATVEYAILGEGAVVGKGARVGGVPEKAENPETWGVAVLGPHTVVADGETVLPKAMLDQTHQEARA